MVEETTALISTAGEGRRFSLEMSKERNRPTTARMASRRLGIGRG
jgi:hypothetical protein